MPYDYGEKDNQLRGAAAERMAAEGYGDGRPTAAEAQPTIQSRLTDTAQRLSEQNKIVSILTDRCAVALRPAVKAVPTDRMGRDKPGSSAMYLPDRVAELNDTISENNARLADLVSRLAL